MEARSSLSAETVPQGAKTYLRGQNNASIRACLLATSNAFLESDFDRLQAEHVAL
jgi:hypothetical protein